MYQRIQYEHFSNICRFCLSEKSTDLTPLFDERNQSLTETLSKMVNLCLGLKVRGFKIFILFNILTALTTHTYNHFGFLFAFYR